MLGCSRQICPGISSCQLRNLNIHLLPFTLNEGDDFRQLFSFPVARGLLEWETRNEDENQYVGS